MASEVQIAMKNDSIPLSQRISQAIDHSHDRGKVKTFDIDWGTDLNIEDPNSGLTALMAASINGKTNAMDILINRGANVNMKSTKLSKSALHLAAKHGQVGAVAMLIHRGGLLNIGDHNNTTPLMYAAKAGNLEVVRCLLAKGAGINYLDDNGWTAIHFAAKFGHKTILEYLYRSGASLCPKENIEGKTPLMLSAEFGRRECTNLLIGLNADINERSKKDNCTALMMACREGYRSIALDLLAHDVNPYLFDNIGWSALHYAASRGRLDTASILLTTGGVPVDCMEADESKSGGTAFTVAVRSGQLEMMKLLMLQGADVDCKDMNREMSAIAYAARNGSTAILECLLDCRADVNSQDRTDMTPLMHAAANGHADCIITLLNKFAEINFYDIDSRNAFDHAVLNDVRDVFLDAVLLTSPEAKVVIAPWLEMMCPKMERSWKHGAGAEYLAKALHGEGDGLFRGLECRPPHMDAYLLGALVNVTVAMKRSAEVEWRDRASLLRQAAELEAMLADCVDAYGMGVDENMGNSVIIGTEPVAKGQLTAAMLYNSFVSGPLALSLDYGLKAMHGRPHLTSMVDFCFWSCDEGSWSFKLSCCRATEVRRRLLRLRYCPAAMVALEALSKFVLLALICFFQVHYSKRRLLFSLGSLVSVVFLSHVVYEVGLVEEKLWAVSASLYLDYPELQRRRYRAALTHFFDDPWKLLDLLTWALLLAWRVSHGPHDSSALLFLSAAAIPLSFGLLRYVSVFLPWLGRLIVSVYFTTRIAVGYLVVYIFSCFGFAVALYGVYRSDLPGFSSPAQCAQTLFRGGMFSQFDFSQFDALPNSLFGVSLLGIFVVWTTVCLFCAMIATLVSVFSHTQHAAEQELGYWKAKMVQTHILTLERSPLCMLPAPLNLLPAALYLPHSLYISYILRYTERLHVISLAGTMSDLLMGLLSIPLACAVEYAVDVYNSREYWLRKIAMVLFFPIGMGTYAMMMLAAVFGTKKTELLTYSRLPKGRLKVRFDDIRDAVEVVGLNEEDYDEDASQARQRGRVKYAEAAAKQTPMLVAPMSARGQEQSDQRVVVKRGSRRKNSLVGAKGPDRSKGRGTADTADVDGTDGRDAQQIVISDARHSSRRGVVEGAIVTAVGVTAGGVFDDTSQTSLTASLNYRYDARIAPMEEEKDMLASRRRANQQAQQAQHAQQVQQVQQNRAAGQDVAAGLDRELENSPDFGVGGETGHIGQQLGPEGSGTLVSFVDSQAVDKQFLPHASQEQFVGELSTDVSLLPPYQSALCPPHKYPRIYSTVERRKIFQDVFYGKLSGGLE